MNRPVWEEPRGELTLVGGALCAVVAGLDAYTLMALASLDALGAVVGLVFFSLFIIPINAAFAPMAGIIAFPLKILQDGIELCEADEGNEKIVDFGSFFKLRARKLRWEEIMQVRVGRTQIGYGVTVATKGGEKFGRAFQQSREAATSFSRAVQPYLKKYRIEAVGVGNYALSSREEVDEGEDLQ